MSVMEDQAPAQWEGAGWEGVRAESVAVSSGSVGHYDRRRAGTRCSHQAHAVADRRRTFNRHSLSQDPPLNTHISPITQLPTYLTGRLLRSLTNSTGIGGLGDSWVVVTTGFLTQVCSLIH